MKAKAITVGILAHVDAGKTTLAEQILYQTGVVRKPGRVDHGDSFLDSNDLEKERGITIFSKQANISLEGKAVTLLDTPGHVDFSAEMGRTLQVLDYALLLISAPDGVTGHVMTLWRLLKIYGIPAFVFVNKMDQSGTDAAAVMRELKEKLGDGFVALGRREAARLFAGGAEADGDAPWPGEGEPDYAASAIAEEDTAFLEEIATADEAALEEYLETDALDPETVRRLIRSRKIFPCLFGSALKGEGTQGFLHFLAAAVTYPEMEDAFAARVFKITREGGVRLTWIRMTGGSLKVKEPLENEEKADQIRVYNGDSFTAVKEVSAGEVCALAGLSSTFAGEGLGLCRDQVLPVLESVISYGVILPEGADVHNAFLQLKQLEEEMPELHVSVSGNRIMVRVMGDVQVQILRRILPQRFGLEADLGEGHIVYRETIDAPVIGSGHYEPLRHYAEARLLLEPGERGSGIVFESACPTDSLDLNWQRLIATHVMEKTHLGVLTGSELTDVHITLLGGRAHLKHTEGGDFREATYRAIRQGLMKAREAGHCRLLEPVYSFRLELPLSLSGRAMADIQSMRGSFEGPETTQDGQRAVLTGLAPVSGMMGYESELRSYSHGMGSLSLQFGGYLPCSVEEQVVETIGYDPEADTANPSGSVFCSHGAGTFIPWYEADSCMHVEIGERFSGTQIPEEAVETHAFEGRSALAKGGAAGRPAPGSADDDELMAIFTRTYGEIRKGRESWKKSRSFYAAEEPRRGKGAGKTAKKPMLLVDGYNVMHGWPFLQKLADENLDAARFRLMDILANYRGYRQMELILVFDAYKVSGGEGEVSSYHGIHVVYTREAETADAYIEKTVHRLAKEFDITVATSDNAEQMIIWGEGARRMPAPELKEEIDQACAEIEQKYLKKDSSGKSYMFETLPEDLRKLLESMRLGDA